MEGECHGVFTVTDRKSEITYQGQFLEGKYHQEWKTSFKDGRTHVSCYQTGKWIATAAGDFRRLLNHRIGLRSTTAL